MKIAHLTAEKVPALWFPLVKKFYQAYYPSGKPNKADPIWVFKDEGRIVSAVRLKQFPSYQLLTAMITLPELQGQGIGSRLLQSIAPALSTLDCYCFAYSHLTHFYQGNGFVTIEINDLPHELRQRFIAYTSQGRQLIPMEYIGPTKNKKAPVV